MASSKELKLINCENINTIDITGVTISFVELKLKIYFISFTIIYMKNTIIARSVTIQKDINTDSILSIIDNIFIFLKNIKKGRLNCFVRLYPNIPTVTNITSKQLGTNIKHNLLKCFLNASLFDILSPKKNINVIYEKIPSNGYVDIITGLISFAKTGYKFDICISGKAIKKIPIKNNTKNIAKNSRYLAKNFISFLTITYTSNNIVIEKKFIGVNTKIEDANLSEKYLTYNPSIQKIHNVYIIIKVLPKNFPNMYENTSSKDSFLLFVNSIFNT